MGPRSSSQSRRVVVAWASSRDLHGESPFRFEWLVTLPLWHVGACTHGGVHPIADVVLVLQAQEPVRPQLS